MADTRHELLAGLWCTAFLLMTFCQRTDQAQPYYSRMSRQGEPATTTPNPIRQFLANNPGRRLGRLPHGQDMDALRDSLKDEDWSKFTVPPITEPNCYIEVQQIQRVPGRCTRLGGHIPACQTQEIVNIDYEACGND